MNDIIMGFKGAFKLLLTFDVEIYSIIFLSIYVTLFSVLFSSLIGVPLGILLGVKEYKHKQRIAKLLYTLMSLPPVVVGLMVAIVISRKGPLGEYKLLFTPTAMIIAQTFLITPIITGIVFNNAALHGGEILELAKTLGCSKRDSTFLLIRELKNKIFVGIVSGFGRGISEVGAVMIVGGNIKHHTRVMTTYIAMNHSMGNYDTSLAMGIVLLSVSYIANSYLYKYINR